MMNDDNAMVRAWHVAPAAEMALALGCIMADQLARLAVYQQQHDPAQAYETVWKWIQTQHRCEVRAAELGVPCSTMWVPDPRSAWPVLREGGAK